MAAPLKNIDDLVFRIEGFSSIIAKIFIDAEASEMIRFSDTERHGIVSLCDIIKEDAQGIEALISRRAA